MKGKRSKTRVVSVGGVKIGGGNPIVVQSMTDTSPEDVKETLIEIRRLKNAGAELVRVAIPDKKSLEYFERITQNSPLPVIADIHFNPELAIEAMKRGAKKIRINPGNITNRNAVKRIINEARARDIPIRIGVNSGSLEKKFLKKYKHPTPEAMVESLADTVEFFEKHRFYDIVLSAKSTDPVINIEANRMLSKIFPYPIHIGLTEAGLLPEGAVWSAVALSPLLLEGIGDTIRISITGDPVREVDIAYEILSSLGLRRKRLRIIACPVCGRAEIDVEKLANEVKKRTESIKDKPLKIAVMGCVVNGPGEAKEADYGIAGGKGKGAIFKKGKIIKKSVKEEKLIDELLKIIKEDNG